MASSRWSDEAVSSGCVTNMELFWKQEKGREREKNWKKGREEDNKCKE
jgi:hypothetical protein